MSRTFQILFINMHTTTHAHTRMHVITTTITSTITATYTTTAILAVVVIYFLLNLEEHFHIPEMIAERCIEFLENDVDVDGADDGAKDAGAFFFVRQSDGHTKCELH